jgi:threonine/homoserine/homoserine lactone efflux protein
MLSVGGIELLPPLATFLAFVLAGLALNIVPGADMTFVIASAARGGRRDGVVAALGIGAGTLVHICAAVLGLSAILASSRTAFDIVKWVGAAYLLYIAVSLVVSGERQSEDGARPARAGLQLFWAAVLVNVLNPKVALFFLAFLPQFVDARASVPALQILCLGLWFDFAGTAVNAMIALIAARAASRLRGLSWVSRTARYLAATVMGALALRLVLAERR